MSNTATITTKRRISLATFHQILRDAVTATYGTDLLLDTQPTDRSVLIRTDDGQTLCQFWYESKGRITVDHRRSLAGYMVADVLLCHIARTLPGRVFETSNGCYMDLTTDKPMYLSDLARAEYDLIRPNRTFEEEMALRRLCDGHSFTGTFAKYFQRT